MFWIFVTLSLLDALYVIWTLHFLKVFPCESLSVNSLSFCLYCAWTEGSRWRPVVGKATYVEPIWCLTTFDAVSVARGSKLRERRKGGVASAVRKSLTYRLHVKRPLVSDLHYVEPLSTTVSRVMLGIVSRLNLESKTCFFPRFIVLFKSVPWISFKASFFAFCFHIFRPMVLSKATISHRVLQAAMIPAAAAVIVVPRRQLVLILVQIGWVHLSKMQRMQRHDMI